MYRHDGKIQNMFEQIGKTGRAFDLRSWKVNNLVKQVEHWPAQLVGNQMGKTGSEFDLRSYPVNKLL